jgi:hypothetical protein
MRTTIELPDELLQQAKLRAIALGISLRQFFIEAVETRLAPPQVKTRRRPPVIGGPDGPRIGILTPEQMDEAMFG